MLNKTIDLIQKFENLLLRPVLITLVKPFIKRDLDYRNITCDKANNSIVHTELKSI